MAPIFVDALSGGVGTVCVGIGTPKTEKFVYSLSQFIGLCAHRERIRRTPVVKT